MKRKLTFTEAKQILTSTELLVQFNPNKELISTCDPILHGIVAVLPHRMDDGTEWPIIYTFQSLVSAEKCYSHLNMKRLAIIFS